MCEAKPDGIAMLDQSANLVWPEDDMLRLLSLLQAQGVVALTAACAGICQQLQKPAAIVREAKGDRSTYMPKLECQQAAANLDLVLAHATQALGNSAPPKREGCWDALRSLEVSSLTEMRYVYGPDWEVKPGKLVSKKGTWLKTSTRFSWDLIEGNKLYLPQGVVMPVLQIGRVVDPVEVKRHEWAAQHLRVWIRPPILRTVDSRQTVWFGYWPHFEDKGLVIVAAVDTWIKRTTQMSGELQPFELIYVPKGLPLRLACEPEEVNEEWEKHRHQHVHLHRRFTLASPPLTVKQDQTEIYIGQGDGQR